MTLISVSLVIAGTRKANFFQNGVNALNPEL